MQSQYAASTSRVREAISRVTIDGRIIPGATVQGLKRSAGTAQQGRIAGGGLVPGAATITVGPMLSAVQAATVAGFITHPWGHGTWPPREGAPVTIEVRQAGAWVRLFTGMTRDVTGSFKDAAVQITCIDMTPKIAGTISIPALAGTIAAPTEGDPLIECSLKMEYVVDLCLRSVGLYATPQIMSGCILSVPMQGSLLPEAGRGTITAARPVDAARSVWSAMHPTRVTMGNATASYLPGGASAGLKFYEAPLEITIMNSAETGAVSTYVDFSDGTAIAFRRTGTGTLYAGLNGANVLVTTVPGWNVAVLRCNGGTWSIATDVSTPLSVAVTIPSTLSNATVTRIRYQTAADGYAAGLQVTRPPGAAFLTAGFTATVEYRTGGMFWALAALPEVQGRNRLDVINEIAQATQTICFFDEHGKFIWWHADKFREARPGVTLSTTTDIADIGWQRSLTDSASRVEIKSRQVATSTMMTRPRLEVWRGTDQQIDAGQVIDLWAEPATDEVWVNPDPTLDIVREQRTQSALSTGSIMAAAVLRTDGTDGLATSDYMAASVTSVTSQTMKITVQNVSTGGISTRAPESNFVPSSWQKRAMPVIRACGRVIFRDDVHTAPVTSPYGATFTHDAGLYVQQSQPGQGPLINFADFLAGILVGKPASISSMQIWPDARLQIGDAVTITYPGLTLTGRIGELADDLAAGSWAETILLVVTSVTSDLLVRDVDERLAGQLIRDVDTRNSPQTIAALDAAGPV